MNKLILKCILLFLLDIVITVGLSGLIIALIRPDAWLAISYFALTFWLSGWVAKLTGSMTKPVWKELKEGTAKMREESAKLREARNPTQPKSEPEEIVTRDTWMSNGREALDIEVPLYVRAWNKVVRKSLDDIDGELNTQTIIMSLIPKPDVDPDEELPFGTAFICSVNMNPVIFTILMAELNKSYDETLSCLMTNAEEQKREENE